MSPTKAKNSEHDQCEQRVRVRNNQRKSRARRQAYTKELELKWSECLKSGAQANVEMQLAARRVALENGFLKDLLRERGLDEEALVSRIQQFWQHRPEHSARNAEAALSPSSCQAPSSHLLRVSCSNSTARTSAAQTPDDKTLSPTQVTEPLQEFSSAAPEVLSTRSANDVSAPTWGFDGWLDDLYDDNGIFNEDLANALDSFITSNMQ